MTGIEGNMVYKRKVTIEDFPDGDFIKLAQKAHEKDITLNELLCNIIADYISTHCKK